jgi:hypothetical protein
MGYLTFYHYNRGHLSDYHFNGVKYIYPRCCESDIFLPLLLTWHFNVTVHVSPSPLRMANDLPCPWLSSSSLRSRGVAVADAEVGEDAGDERVAPCALHWGWLELHREKDTSVVARHQARLPPRATP